MTMRPVPTPDFTTAPYWEHAKAHEFWLPKCRACGHFHFYPRTICPFCGSDRIEWRQASGRGSIYTFTLVQRAPSPAFEPLVPYAVAAITLDEGPHLMSNVVNCDVDQIRIGSRVAVRYLDIDPDCSLPIFELDAT